ncbi:helix-turn-helix domain-containing protein [Streptococcus ratti]|uniref:helix-turn-helix domain-containing protein n=1 Tax=Streptococcus ratti TaxID=1341 RepID=UPI001CA7E297|nr:helix-turn-helix transcriptional regulator [Streptococcus ratti]
MENQVKTLRKAAKKTMKELSEETGIGLSSISNYENGYSNPKKNNAKILADYFGVSIPYLLGLDDNPNLVDPGAPKEVLKNSAIYYSYSEDKASVIVELKDSSNAEQVTIMQEMLSKGYSLKAVDTTYSDGENYDQSSVIINMYFETRAG